MEGGKVKKNEKNDKGLNYIKINVAQPQFTSSRGLLAVAIHLAFWGVTGEGWIAALRSQ